MLNMLQSFKNPPNEFRGKPFWSLNGKLERDEMLKQINVMKIMGFGGFFIHSRTGLQTEYLGEDWFSLVNDCIKEAKRLQMEVWLYDEDRWPSGTAGGSVTMKPEFRQKYICLDILEKEDFDIANYYQEYLNSFAVLMNGDALLDYYEITQRIQVKDGYRVLVFKVCEMEKDSFYNGYTYVDTLNKQATEYYISLTHEKYKQMCGDYFGKEILGIFTDEPYRGALFSGFALHNNPQWESMVPYTYQLFDVFKGLFGYDLLKKLPELYYKRENEIVSKISWQYVECIQQMFLNNFTKPYYEWCKANKLMVTGHILHEDSLSIQTSLSGSMMRYYEYMDYPGVDILTEGNKNFWVVKQCSSVARQLSKKFVLSELYGCTGWQFNFQSHKTVGDWQAALGINFRCHHLSWYTMEGEAKRDYPASILHQSTYWRDYSYVEDYFSRMGYILSQGKPVCDALVINPVESVWALVHKDWINGFEAQDEIVKEIEKSYCDLFHTLTDLKIDFDYADEDILARHFRIEMVDKKPVLYVGKAKYEKVIVSGLLTMRSTTLSILKKFAELGGKVIFIGEMPNYIDCEKAIIDVDNSVKIPHEKSLIFKECASELVISVKSDNEEIKELICSVRKIEDDYFCFIVNTNRLVSYHDVQISMNEHFHVEEWNLRNGETVGTNFNNKEGETTIQTNISAGGERLFRLTKKSVSKSSLKTAQPIHEIHLNKPMEYELSEDNVCVLDIAEYCINDDLVSSPMEILKIDREVRSKLNLPYRGGQMNQPWFDKKYNTEKNNGVLCSIELKFSFFVEMIPTKIELVLEKQEDFQIYINEKQLIVDSTGKWIDICFDKIKIDASLFCIGENTLTLKTAFSKERNLEAIYLLGDFGVKIDGYQKTLTALPQMLNIGDITTQGLPFYSGKIRYQTSINNTKARVKLNDCYGALVKAVSADEESVIAFSPFESKCMNITKPLILELILTRRNTFGPLHLNPVHNEWYGPYEFITEGERFSVEYKLIETGLLTPPIIEMEDK